MRTWLIHHHTKVAAAVAASIWIAPLTALADVTAVEAKIPARFTNFDSVITNIFNIVITVAGIAFVVLFLLGGIMYLTSAGAEEPSKKARQLMLDAVIGLGIVVTAWAVGTYVLEILGVSKAGKLNLDPSEVGN